MLKQYVVDATQVPWKRGQTEGITFRCQVLLDGKDGGPEAIRFQFDPCLSVYAHMHLTSQFQLLIGGTMDFPKESMRMRPPAVHYTDHKMPYGPFAVGAGHDVLVLHPKQGGLISMADRGARKQINLAARELSGMDKDIEWLSFPEYQGSRCKMLIPHVLGPEVVMLECQRGTRIALGPAPYGRYEVVLKGSVLLDGQALASPGLRYVRGEELPEPLVAGPDGATVIFLSFDKDALSGGLDGDALAASATEQLARAI